MTVAGTPMQPRAFETVLSIGRGTEIAQESPISAGDELFQQPGINLVAGLGFSALCNQLPQIRTAESTPEFQEANKLL